MAWYEWLLSVLLFIVSLGILVTIHEAGHLAMAKLFKVYCREFSIGFGSKILQVKKEGHETTFSIRVLPLGGYVSMYGEGAEELEEFKDIPPERSLEGIKKWKKAIVVLAGVILNAVLAFILILISNVAFPMRSPTRNLIIAENSSAERAGLTNESNIDFVYPEEYEEDGGIYPFTYQYETDDKVIHMGNFFIADPNVAMIPDSDPGVYHHYVLTFYFNGDKDNSVFTDGMKLYPAISSENLSSNSFVNDLFGEWNSKEVHPDYYPDFTSSAYIPGPSTTFEANIISLDKDGVESTKKVTFSTKLDGNEYVWDDVGMSFKIVDEWLPVSERFKNTFRDYGNASVAVFKGIGILFTGGIRNMSGIVGIFETSASLLSNYTFATYLYFWGLISVNLAIFNLLPFPGLDGWQLLVTIIEGISHKKLPNKFKSIMSFIGLALLMVLMIAIVIMDITRIAGGML